MPIPCRNIFLALVALAMFAPRTAAQSAAKNPPHVDVPTIAPRAEDVSSLDGLIAAYYDVISGPAGRPRQWSRDRTLYIPDIRFVAMSLDNQRKPTAHVVSHQQYVDNSNADLLAGFYEKEIHRVTQRFGNIAHVFSTYQSRLKADGSVIARGINSIEAFWDGKRWWIASAIWDEERPDDPLPAQYLPGGETEGSPKK
jgi:hypothetical protein